MNKIDSSLCSNCIYTESCTLTESKRFIWSCSEFEVNKPTRKHDSVIKKTELELI
ncbi:MULTISPECIES: hypothetical protein [Flavobacteriaceae]|uniref:Uncharacterized protein n=1 Tax=Lutibacter litoralis TaxID=321268 RepID=A0ABV5JXR5_9FLAO|nr:MULTISPECIES: hypothetical protein [Flavobacteriaceae]